MKLPAGFELISDEPATKTDNFNLPEGFELVQDKPQKEASFSGAAKAYGSGLAGGAGGFAADLGGILPSKKMPSSLPSGANPFLKGLDLKGTHELSEQIGGTPQNALERILRQSGEFGGLEGLIGAGLGGAAGPAGAAVGGVAGTAHGSASGAVYGGLKELGVPDMWALGITAALTVSPVAGRKLYDAYKAGKPLRDATKALNFAEREAVMKATEQSGPKVSRTPSQFDAAEEAIQSIEPKIGGKPLGIEVPVAPKEGGSPLIGRVTEQPGPGHSISPVEFQSEAQGGQALNQSIRDAATSERASVTEAYNLAQENYQNINSVADDFLVQELNKEIDKLKTSIKPNTAESSVLNTLEQVRNHYLVRNGVPVGDLIKTSDSISGMANYELPFTGPKDILKRVANTLDRAALRAIENNGGNPELMRNANQMYRKWANRYSTDDISPFLERTVNNPESLFRKAAKDEGSFRAVQQALSGQPREAEFINAVSRKVAESKMKDYMGKGIENVGSQKYYQDLNNLRDLIGKNKADQFDKALRNRKRLSLKERSPLETSKPKPESKPLISRSQTLNRLAEKNAKTMGFKSPEDILKKLETRKGIRELREVLPKEQFDKLIEAKARAILADNKVLSSPTGQQMFSILNQEKNFEIFSEMVGKENATELLETFQRIGKAEATKDRVISTSRKAGRAILKGTLAGKAMSIILSLI